MHHNLRSGCHRRDGSSGAGADSQCQGLKKKARDQQVQLPYLMGEETEAQRGLVTGLRSHSNLVIKVELEYNYLDIFISKHSVAAFLDYDAG